MMFKGCRRCSGDLWAEMDIGSRSEDLVCLQCGHRQTIQAAAVGPSTEEPTNATPWLMSQRPSKVAAGQVRNGTPVSPAWPRRIM